AFRTRLSRPISRSIDCDLNRPAVAQPADRRDREQSLICPGFESRRCRAHHFEALIRHFEHREAALRPAIWREPENAIDARKAIWIGERCFRKPIALRRASERARECHTVERQACDTRRPRAISLPIARNESSLRIRRWCCKPAAIKRRLFADNRIVPEAR